MLSFKYLNVKCTLDFPLHSEDNKRWFTIHLKWELDKCRHYILVNFRIKGWSEHTINHKIYQLASNSNLYFPLDLFSWLVVGVASACIVVVVWGVCSSSSTLSATTTTKNIGIYCLHQWFYILFYSILLLKCFPTCCRTQGLD